MKELYELITKKIRNKQTVFIILIIGIVLMLAAGSFKENKKEDMTYTYTDSQQYRRNLENELTDILSRMEGVGEVHVMITLENRNTADASLKNQPSQTVLKRTDDFDEYAAEEFYPVIKGVVIVAQGASSQAVSEKIYYAAKAALDIGGSKIAVVEAK